MASPDYPRTNGRIKSHHHTIKREIGLISCEMAGSLDKAIISFVDYYSY